MKKVGLLLAILICAFALQGLEYQLPKVLFITTGDGDGQGTVSDGVVLALQEFNKIGAFVRLENRSVLYNIEELNKYQIMIIPTTFGYHDADRRYSLSFLSETEMQNISNWVKQGGTLVSDSYLGRNTLNGEDRISEDNTFTSDNWKMAECFGVELKELNMQNYLIESRSTKLWQGNITAKFEKSEWTPVVIKQTGKEQKTLAVWNNAQNYPAIVENSFHKGKTILLSSFNLIHPACDGGFSSAEEIQAFYNYVYQTSLPERNYAIQLNPWKNGASTALCLSFNNGGKLQEYNRIIKYLNKNKLPATYFLTNKISPEVKNLLEKQKYITLESHSQTNPDFRKISYSQALQEIQENNSNYVNEMEGFRFPFVNNSFWGMKALDELKFLYDSSIGLNHLEFYRGSLFPYNIPIFKDGYFEALDLLEISQNFHDDWYYLKGVHDGKSYGEENQKRDAAKFDAYLQTMWERAVKPENGLMVFVGHATYSGMSDLAMQPLKDLVSTASKDGAWITNLHEISTYWNQLRDLSIEVEESEKQVEMSFNLPSGELLTGLSFCLPSKPEKIIYNGKYDIKKVNGEECLILKSVKDGEKVIIQY